MNQIYFYLLLTFLQFSLNDDNINNLRQNADEFQYVQKKNITQYYIENTISAKQWHEVWIGHIPLGQTPQTPDWYMGSNSQFFYQLISANGKYIDNPDPTVPLILWLQGGPGCSDWYASLEMGPYKISYNEETKKYSFIENEYTWALDNYILFIDQPYGVGYSIPVGDPEQIPTPNSTYVAMQQLEQVLESFFTIYPQLKSNPFYIFGESFGGHYIPGVASLILTNPQSTIKLSGIGIGDGWYANNIQGAFMGSYFWTTGTIPYHTFNYYKLMQGQLIEDYYTCK